MDIQQILNNVWPLPPVSLQLLAKHIKEVHFPKGHLLIQADKIETSIYFLKKGIARAYVLQDGNEVTFWFGKEGDLIFSMKNYIENKHGYEMIELLENSELYQIKTITLQTLYQNDIHMANWGRKLAEQELIKTEERLISRQFRTASERYATLMQKSPELLQRVQLGHIASFLGITQVSLSRIRAEMK